MRPKWRGATLWAGKRTGGNSDGDTQRQGSEIAVQPLSSIALATALQDGTISIPAGTTRGLEAGLTQSSLTVNDQRLAPPREPIHFSTNTRIVPSSSPPRGKASRHALLFQPPSPACLASYPTPSLRLDRLLVAQHETL